jgi:RNA polymerase sigma-70 factor, ECF subfamily
VSADSYSELVEPHRAELRAHCYRMLGSVQDADDALQEALLRAWRGLPRFQGRSSLRSWLYLPTVLQVLTFEGDRVARSPASSTRRCSRASDSPSA